MHWLVEKETRSMKDLCRAYRFNMDVRPHRRELVLVVTEDVVRTMGKFFFVIQSDVNNEQLRTMMTRGYYDGVELIDYRMGWLANTFRELIAGANVRIAVNSIRRSILIQVLHILQIKMHRMIADVT